MQKINISASSRKCWYVQSQAEADQVLSRVLNEMKPSEEQIFLDTETCSQERWKHEFTNKSLLYKPGLDPFKSSVRLLQLGWRDTIWIFDMFHIKDRTKMRLLLEHDDLWTWIHNGKFDYKHCAWDLDIIISNIACMLAAAKVLGHDPAHLNYLAQHYLNRTLRKENQVSDWSVPELTPEQLAYAGEDIDVMMDLREPMVRDLKKRGLWSAFSIETQALAPTGEMEINGTKIHTARHKATIDRKMQEGADLRTNLITMLAPHIPQMTFPGMQVGINLGSHQKLLDVLQRAGLDITGTSKEQLKLHALDHPVTPLLLAYKKTDKMVSGFGSLPDAIHPVTGRTHPTFEGLFTSTFRFSSSKYNIQQIPRDEECRAWFVPEDGWKIVMADYSAIEMVGGAVVSKDEKLLDIFRRKLKLSKCATEEERRACDPHYVTATIITGKILTEIIKKERQDAKPANFGLLYGMSWKGFRIYAFVEYGVMFTEAEAKQIRQRYFSPLGYAGLGRWHAVSKERYRDVPVVHTIAGYQLALSYNTEYDSFAGPASLNYQVQNPCAAGNKRALAMLHKRYRAYMHRATRGTGPMLVRTIHDENHLEAPERMAEDARLALEQDMKAGMDKVFKCDDLVFVEAHTGDSWADKA